MPETPLYDKLAGSYDLLISWKRRLKRERPFFTRIFKEFRVRRILDTAAGTGMHAIAFHDWGYHVIGADISEKMVEKAGKNAGTRKIEFIQAGFTEPGKIGGMFDAVTCLGNSLPHVLTDEELERSLSSMYDLLLPGGVLIIHNNNYDRILGRGERFMPLAQSKEKGQDYLFLRFFDFHDDRLVFHVVTLTKRSGEWQMTEESTAQRALTCDLLTRKLREAGFVEMRIYGGYPDQPFSKTDSDNLIVVAQKPHTLVSRPTPEPVAAIDRIPVRENGEPLVEISNIQVRQQPVYARQTVAEMLRKAQSMLPEGYKFLVKTAYRSLEFQTMMYERHYKQVAAKHPEWSVSQIRREVNKFLAPPDAKHPPGHTTGGAVDLTILGPDGRELDMTSTIKPVESHMASFPTYSKLITPRAAKNRQMLVNIMLNAGFSNYPGEWWHYSYGESAWALRTGAPYAVYGAAAGEQFPPSPVVGAGGEGSGDLDTQ